MCEAVCLCIFPLDEQKAQIHITNDIQVFIGFVFGVIGDLQSHATGNTEEEEEAEEEEAEEEEENSLKSLHDHLRLYFNITQTSVLYLTVLDNGGLMTVVSRCSVIVISITHYEL